MGWVSTQKTHVSFSLLCTLNLAQRAGTSHFNSSEQFSTTSELLEARERPPSSDVQRRDLVAFEPEDVIELDRAVGKVAGDTPDDDGAPSRTVELMGATVW